MFLIYLLIINYDKIRSDQEILKLTGQSNDECGNLLSSRAAWNTARNLPLCLCINCQLQGIKLLCNAAISKQIDKAHLTRCNPGCDTSIVAFSQE